MVSQARFVGRILRAAVWLPTFNGTYIEVRVAPNNVSLWLYLL
ncbi:hypothetical protein ABT275_37180 [Streptomyces sp. NPDC001185]